MRYIITATAETVTAGIGNKPMFNFGGPNISSSKPLYNEVNG